MAFRIEPAIEECFAVSFFQNAKVDLTMVSSGTMSVIRRISVVFVAALASVLLGNMSAGEASAEPDVVVDVNTAACILPGADSTGSLIVGGVGDAIFVFGKDGSIFVECVGEGITNDSGEAQQFSGIECELVLSDGSSIFTTDTEAIVSATGVVSVTATFIAPDPQAQAAAEDATNSKAAIVDLDAGLCDIWGADANGDPVFVLDGGEAFIVVENQNKIMVKCLGKGIPNDSGKAQQFSEEDIFCVIIQPSTGDMFFAEKVHAVVSKSGVASMTCTIFKPL